MDHATQGDLIARSAKVVHRLLHHEHRRSGVVGAGNGQERCGYILRRRVVIAEGRQQPLACVRHIADCCLDAWILHGGFGGETRKIIGDLAAQQPYHRGPTHTAADAADTRSIDTRAEIRVRQHQIDHRFHTERSQRLHLDDAIKIADDVDEVTQVFDAQSRKTTIAVKRCGNDVAVARQPHQKINRLAVDRAARQTMREHHHRPATASGWQWKSRGAWLAREYGSLTAALHMRDALSIRQQVVGPIVGAVGRVARDDDKINHRISPSGIQIVVRHGSAGFQGAGGFEQDVTNVVVVGTRPIIVERTTELIHACDIVGEVRTRHGVCARPKWHHFHALVAQRHELAKRWRGWFLDALISVRGATG